MNQVQLTEDVFSTLRVNMDNILNSNKMIKIFEVISLDLNLDFNVDDVILNLLQEFNLNINDGVITGDEENKENFYIKCEELKEAYITQHDIAVNNIKEYTSKTRAASIYVLRNLKGYDEFIYTPSKQEYVNVFSLNQTFKIVISEDDKNSYVVCTVIKGKYTIEEFTTNNLDVSLNNYISKLLSEGYKENDKVDLKDLKIKNHMKKIFFDLSDPIEVELKDLSDIMKKFRGLNYTDKKSQEVKELKNEMKEYSSRINDLIMQRIKNEDPTGEELAERLSEVINELKL